MRARARSLAFTCPTHAPRHSVVRRRCRAVPDRARTVGSDALDGGVTDAVPIARQRPGRRMVARPRSARRDRTATGGRVSMSAVRRRSRTRRGTPDRHAGSDRRRTNTTTMSHPTRGGRTHSIANAEHTPSAVPDRADAPVTTRSRDPLRQKRSRHGYLHNRVGSGGPIRRGLRPPFRGHRGLSYEKKKTPDHGVFSRRFSGPRHHRRPPRTRGPPHRIERHRAQHRP